MKSVFQFALPIDVEGIRYDNETDRRSEQSSKFRKLLMDDYAKYVRETYSKKDATGFSASLECFALNVDQLLNVIIYDALYATVALTFVFFWFNVHLRSCWLGLVGTSLIMFSFPVTVLLCKGIGKVDYISFLHVLAVFIVLGIAADDVFVFIDAWRQSAEVPEEIMQGDLKRRMAYTFRRASRAMSVTSSTTMAAFFANVFSNVMPIKSFGIYAGIIIPLNFIFVVLFFPSATILYERCCAGKCCCCCNCCPFCCDDESTKRKKDEDDEAEEENNEMHIGRKLRKTQLEDADAAINIIEREGGSNVND